MRPTYADLLSVSTAPRRGSQASPMPLLGFLTGLPLALILWSGICGLAWALLA